MKILVVCQYYYPEPFRISDICESLVKIGYEVTVVTGVPNYPEGVIYNGYEKKQKRFEIINGVKVIRAFTIPRKSGVLYRFLNYYSYSVSSSKIVSRFDSDYDVVLINQLSPVMMANAGIAYAKKQKKPCFLYCLDLWPESLVAGGIRKDSLIYKYYKNVSNKIYSEVDRIFVTSNMFTKYLWDYFLIPEEKITYLPQYAENIFSNVVHKTDNQYYDFVFAGNIGEIQDVETIIYAAAILEMKNVRWHIIGNGSNLENLKILVRNKKLRNIFFYGRKPLEEMPSYYSLADAMLITLKPDPILSLTLPGKIQSYMAAGKPIIGAIDGEASLIINDAKCGFCGRAGDAELLAENIKKFISCGEKEQMGINARKYYEKHFTQTMFLKKLEKELKNACIDQ